MTQPLRAKDHLKGAMKTFGFGYKQLSAALARKGVHLTPKSLSTRINRGAFTADFYFLCLHVMGAHMFLVPAPHPASQVRRSR